MKKKIQISLNDLWDALDESWRYVTMDNAGACYAFITRPMSNQYGGFSSDNSCKYIGSHIIEITDFAGKPWTECIAERLKKEPDYSKWIGSFIIGEWGNGEGFSPVLMTSYSSLSSYPFKTTLADFENARPATKEEVLKYLIEE